MATILAVSAHPDDETMFAGGMLAMYAAAGHAVYILETTRGEGGEAGDPPLAAPHELGALREQEARAAGAALGAQAVRFLPFVDPTMTAIGGSVAHIDVPLDQFAAAIGAQIAELQPDLVITHGSNGEYGHPQHIYTHRAVQLALAAVTRPIALATWSAWHLPHERERMLNHDDRATHIFDISPWFAAKLAAAACHRSQHAMFYRNTELQDLAAIVLRYESLRLWRGELPDTARA
ncbi:MAG: hypothetical protein HC822_04475 [Oscillochloris sp.]|nr:hypothetical protein [Oscillochloris sp.]